MLNYSIQLYRDIYPNNSTEMIFIENKVLDRLATTKFNTSQETVSYS